MVRKVNTETWDWVFGQGLANYLTNNDEIIQNVQTRLKSFKNDYFLNIEAGLDWFNLLSVKNSGILEEIREVVILTNGIIRVNEISILENNKRFANILINFDTIFNKNIQKEFNLNA